MLDKLNSVMTFPMFNYHTNFKSNSDNQTGINFKYNLRPTLTADVFEKTISGGINGSNHNGSKLINSLLPIGEIKSLSPSARDAERNKKINQEKDRIAKTVTKRTQQNTAKLRSAGISERDVKKYLTYDGHLNTEGKRILREKGISYS